MTQARQQRFDIFYIRVSGAARGGANSGFKFAFRAPRNKYNGILREIGATRAKNNERDLVFGANQPRLPRVRINFEKTAAQSRAGAGTARSDSQIIFCDPRKIAEVTVGNSLRGKRSNGRRIASASVVGVKS